MDDIATAIVETTLPDATVTGVADISGMAHRTAAVDLDSADRVIARWCIHDHLVQRFEREAAVLDAVAGIDAPTPDLLGHDHSAADLPPYTVMTFLPGDRRGNRFHEPHDLADAELRSAGETLARIHASDADVPSFRGLDGDWPSVLHGIVARHIDQLEGYAFQDLMPDLRAAVDRGLESVDAAPKTVLLHHDFRPSNLLFRDGDVTGVVDWERAMHGDPLYDLVKAEMNVAGVHAAPEDVPDAFRDGYASVRDLDRDPARSRLYRLMHTVEVLWAHPIWRERFPWPERDGVKERLRETVGRRTDAVTASRS